MEINELFWLICGIVGILFELLISGFVLIFFGIGALVTAACTYFISDITTTWQVIIFIAVSCGTLAFFRKSFKQILFSRKAPKERDELAEEFQGKTAVVLEDFVAQQGKVELNGSSWKATANENFAKGDVVFIQKRDNLTLIVTKNKED
ncbi:MAG: NfeD family protein [Bacteroidales bacterium]|jgi:membrane protein implicated in regulation of membrane protease activity|nr:NfeD family protein [Bacteroidales bacterium]